MVLRECALPHVGGRDRRVDQLGELDQGVGRAGPQHALAGPDQRPFGVEQQRDGTLDIARVGRAAVPDRRRVLEQRVVELLLGDVERQLQEDRAGTPRAHQLERPAHLLVDGLRRGKPGRPLRDGPVGLHRVEGGPQPQLAQGVAVRQQQQRYRIGVGLGDTTERVLGARTVLDHRDADALSVRDPAVRVGHVDDAALLPPHDRPYPHRRRGIDHLVGREAEDLLDAFAPQHLGDRLATLHAPIPSPFKLH